MSAAAELASPNVRWDLSALFDSFEDPRIPALWERIEKETDAFAADYRGKIHRPDLTATELADSLRRFEALLLDYSKPLSYGNLRFSVEATNPEAGAFLMSQMEKGTAVRVKLVFYDLEIQALTEEHFQRLLNDDALANYRHYLRRVREATPFMLSEAEERILEEVANTGTRAWVRLHDETLTHHKFHFLNPETGETEELTESETLAHLRSANRQVRINAGNALSEGLKSLSHLLTFLYNTLLQDKAVDDRLRNRPTPEHSRHMANELDGETVDLVMQLCKEYEPQVARYYRLKRDILGLPELTHVDRYAPIFETSSVVSWDEAREIVLSSFGKFSPVIAEQAQEFFDKNWIDAEAREGKTGGAFCSYITPDLHPVVMMSYLNKPDDVMTLAHELGHGVHGAFSRAQSYLNFDGSLPLAELASIFGEQLVFERLTTEASPEDQLALYAQKIEGIFASVFRQAAMFRFEQRCHRKRRAEGELTTEEFGEIWQDELQGMFGDSVRMEDDHRYWWSYVGHFIFAPFYVYAYSFGELLTMALYEKAKTAGPEFAERYVEVLRLGGSKTPHELMAIVGADLRDEQFWRGGFAVIERTIAKFEELWAARR